MEDTAICGNCRYWMSMWEVKGLKPEKLADGSDDRRSKRGQCRRYAPRASALTLHWPWMKVHETCGEFSVRKDDHRGEPAETDAPGMMPADL